MNKVILIDDEGKKTEFKKFVLYAINENGSMSTVIDNIKDDELAYITKRMQCQLEMKICDSIREQQAFSNLKVKLNK